MKYWSLLLLFLSVAASAAPINQTDYFSLSTHRLTDFESVAIPVTPSVNFDETLWVDGIGFSERFVGQVVMPFGDNDILSAAPVGPLTLVQGAALHNTSVVIYDEGTQNGKVFAGIGTVPFPSLLGLGEGSFAMQFSSDQSQIGLSLVGGDAGSAFLSFFRRDGSLIDSVVLGGLGETGFYGFARAGGIHDIAGISVFNDDLAGIGLDNIKHDVVSSVPEPGMYLMLLVGLALVGNVGRRLS